MMNDWTEFKGVRQRVSLRNPKVTLGKKLDMYFSARTLEVLGNPKAVRFFFDVSRSLIGIRKETPDADQAFPIYMNKGGRSSTGKLYAGIFCNAFGIRPEHTITFNDIHVDADGIMILDLKTATRARR